MRYWLPIFLSCHLLFASPNAPLQTLYYTLDPSSISKHLAFYELYPDTEEGKAALSHAWKLLGGDTLEELRELQLPTIDLTKLLHALTKNPLDTPVILNQEQLKLIQNLGKTLSHHALNGSTVFTKQETLSLPPEQIDLARGLLIDELEGDPLAQEKILQYEALLDLMALQIRARLPKEASPLHKLHAMNDFIFYEMQFRFPPHSIYAKDIDLYTFLPSVLDNREGVCLGVCILYLSLAQRLDLPLEIITPPGHIYVRYHDQDHLINIETTARGIDLPSDTYLSIHTRKLKPRTLKEVIGMAFMNQAAVFLGKEDYTKAAQLYEKASSYLSNDPFLKMLQGCAYLFTGKKKEGMALLKAVGNTPFDEAVSPETIPEDLLKKKVDPEGVKLLFLPVDETRESILKKQQELQRTLKKYPHFRAGIFMLATTWLQLGRNQEALDLLKTYHKIDPSNATVEYYLAALSAERLSYQEAWLFLKNAEKLTQERDHHPKVLKGLKAHLKALSPEAL